jgi:hypothetical protein
MKLLGECCSSSTRWLAASDLLPQASDPPIPERLKVLTKATTRGEGLFPLRGLRTRFVNYLSQAGDTRISEKLSALKEITRGARFPPRAPLVGLANYTHTDSKKWKVVTKAGTRGTGFFPLSSPSGQIRELP